MFLNLITKKTYNGCGETAPELVNADGFSVPFVKIFILIQMHAEQSVAIGVDLELAIHVSTLWQSGHFVGKGKTTVPLEAIVASDVRAQGNFNFSIFTCLLGVGNAVHCDTNEKALNVRFIETHAQIKKFLYQNL